MVVEFLIGAATGGLGAALVMDRVWRRYAARMQAESTVWRTETLNQAYADFRALAATTSASAAAIVQEDFDNATRQKAATVSVYRKDLERSGIPYRVEPDGTVSLTIARPVPLDQTRADNMQLLEQRATSDRQRASRYANPAPRARAELDRTLPIAAAMLGAVIAISPPPPPPPPCDPSPGPDVSCTAAAGEPTS